MDDFRRLDAFSDSTDDPFGSAPDRRVDRAERRRPSVSVARAWHRVAGLLLALGIGGGSLALFLSILVVNLLPVVLVCLLLLIVSAVIAFRFRRSSPDLTAMRLIWRVAPTVGMLYGIAVGLAFASGNSQLDTVTVIVLAGVGAIGGIVCAAGAALALRSRDELMSLRFGRVGGCQRVVPFTVEFMAGEG